MSLNERLRKLERMLRPRAPSPRASQVAFLALNAGEELPEGIPPAAVAVAERALLALEAMRKQTLIEPLEESTCHE